MAREEGIKVGLLRPITLWPFPSKAIAARAAQVKGILTVELNAGQMVEDVRLAVKCKVPVEHFGRLGGIVPDPDEVITALKAVSYTHLTKYSPVMPVLKYRQQPKM